MQTSSSKQISKTAAVAVTPVISATCVHDPWLTGNLGYHHVHHLHAKIPFYRLPEAMAGLPALQSPTITTICSLPAKLSDHLRRSMT